MFVPARFSKIWKLTLLEERLIRFGSIWDHPWNFESKSQKTKPKWLLEYLIKANFCSLRCDPSNSLGKVNCSFCPPGSYSDEARTCVKCPAGGFYQDEMGETECKTCSNGTYVSEERHPGKSATDCWACPYGTRSNETAGYRACRCLHGFYRLDRFGPCSACPAYGIDCNDDTAILAPNYFWNWTDQTKLFYKSFVDNINTISPTYNKTFSKFNSSLPKPLKCPRVASCRGGIDSKCNEGYRGILCASCTSDHYLRFNACLKCPSMTVTLISSIGVIVIFVVVFMMVLWGDSKATSDSRTIADVIMSCFKIVIGFYQVVTGIFSSLVRVHWPVALISMEKYLHFVEGNIFQFAPFSCVHPRLRLDQFQKFVLIISVNALVVFLILVYLLLRGRYIKGGLDCLNSEKLQAMSTLKKSCYRNIFLFLLASYPITSNAIIRILPLPGSCVEICFTEDRNDCTSLLRADFSIKCFTLRHKFYWPIAAVFALYPVGFPLLVLLLIYKFRGSSSGENISFGLRVFFENYKKKFWFWEIIEMYRKLILTSLILFFGSDNISQNGFTVAMVSTFGVVYTLLCPIKDKFEDTLQILVLWIIFFDVCLGAMYTNYDVSESHKANGSIAINILFVLLNSSVLLVALASIAYIPVTENNRLLVGHVFQQLYTRDWFNCIQACHDEPRCISYNYERSAGDNGLCELNDCGVDGLWDRDNSLIYSVGFVFQQIKEDKQMPHQMPQTFPEHLTAPALPPQNVTAINKTSTSIFITWTTVPANQRNGDILGYKVDYKRITATNTKRIITNASVHRANLTSLGKHRRYIITVLAFNQHGDGPGSEIMVVRTKKDKPDEAPQNLTAVNKTSTSILITWDEVPLGERNGAIQSYEVNYTPVANDNKTSQVIEAPAQYLLLSNLQKNTDYSITVLACNVIGCGPASQPIFVATDQNNDPPHN
ncbi:hypothetical protein ACROYT_G016578 [Oculina patagonica]